MRIEGIVKIVIERQKQGKKLKLQRWKIKEEVNFNKGLDGDKGKGIMV